MTQKNKRDPQGLYSRAIEFHQNGRLVDAEKIYRRLLKQFPGQGEILGNLGSALIGQGKIDSGARAVEKGLKLQPENAAGWSTLGTARLQQGRLADAVAAYLKASALEPENAATYYNLGNAEFQLGSVEAAGNSFEKAVELNPEFTEAWANWGRVLIELGDRGRALVALQRSIELAPDLVSAQVNLAKLQKLDGDLDGAIGSLEAIVAKSPDSELGQVALGEAYLDADRDDEALECMSAALDLNPQHVDAHIFLGNIHQQNNRPLQAIECFESALAAKPDHPGAEESLRRALSRQIPAWHFPMLADGRRNEAYRQAIEKAVAAQAPAHVLDIGAGSGLLAMMAARVGAKRVTAVEMNSALARTAERIVSANRLNKKIQVLARKSTQLSAGDGFGPPADLIVSEILDNGLLGEGVIPTMRHALEHLAEAGARVIPARATVFAQVMEIPHLKAVNPIGEIAGFDLSEFDRFRSASDYQRVFLESEPHRVLSEPFVAFELNFSQPPKELDDARPEASEFQVVATSAGEPQSVVFWFDLELDDDIKVSSGKGGEMVHWGQAVNFLEWESRCAVEEGDNISLKMLRTDQRIQFVPGK